ncbi:MAG: RtcB family protein [Herpetosiphonaceae bacterium]|nr:RtcB family protein [Herpetosiphonaceae bacterium]
MHVIDNIPVWGEPDEATLAQIKRCARDELVAAAALMADAHKGYSQPIGGVIAYRDAVSPSGVGYDIACGIKGVRTMLRAADLRPHIATIMDNIARAVVFGVGQRSGLNVDHPLFDDPTWQDIPELGILKDLARQQLGTVGSGNHFVDVLADEADSIWVVCHFGSRGLGHKTATGFLNLAANRSFFDRAPGEQVDQRPTLIATTTDLGQSYVQAMRLAGRYAYAGRDAVVDQVLRLLGTHAVDEVHNHHNFAWSEQHNGEQLWVVRKGATPAFPGQRGIVGGSMGDITAVIEGVDGPEAEQALYSTVHGAGRIMSRTQAAGKRKWLPDPRTGKKVPTIVAPGAVSAEMMHEWLRREGVELRGGGLDESPHVYRRLPDVLHAHARTIKVVHTLRPLGVAMAGAEVIDPYKD